jgi:hypothetical protein
MTQQTPEYVLVIGAARSGTKFVRDLIGSSVACKRVPFDVNFVWRTGNEAKENDSLQPADCTSAIGRHIERTLQRLSRWRPGCGARFVVEKTVSNCLRIPFIEKALPHVRYVHLLRDGRDVVESSFRMWNQPVSWRYLLQKARYLPIKNVGYAFWYARNMLRGLRSRRRGVGVWGVRYPGIEIELKANTVAEICARQWAVCTATAMRHLASVPPSRKLEIRYEDFADTPRELQRICEFLELPDPETVETYYKNELNRGRSEAWRNAFDAESWASIMAILAPQLRALGYLDQADSEAAAHTARQVGSLKSNSSSSTGSDQACL